MQELQDFVSVLGIEDDVNQQLVLLVALMGLQLENQPRGVMIAEDDLAELLELDGVVGPHFGIQEADPVLGEDQIGGIPVSFCIHEESMRRQHPLICCVHLN